MTSTDDRCLPRKVQKKLFLFLVAYSIEKLILPICVNQGIFHASCLKMILVFVGLCIVDISFYNTTNNSDLVILIVHCGICDYGLYSKVNMWSTNICVRYLKY